MKKMNKQKTRLEKLDIDWEIEEMIDRLEWDFAEYRVVGTDSAGIQYTGICTTFISDPEIDDVYEIEYA